MDLSENFEIKIGFDRIRILTREQCLSTLGHEHIEKIKFKTDHETINTSLEQVSEFKQILSENPDFPSDHYYNMIPGLIRIKTSGTHFEESSLHDLRASLQTIGECFNFFHKKPHSRAFPELCKIFNGLSFNHTIVQNINAILDEKGVIRSDASPELNKIRSELITKKGSVDKKIAQVLIKIRKEGWLSEETSVTIRNGRVVLPVPVTYKRKVKGFIHDESSSGQTAYIEPLEVFNLNNEIRDLENSEKREIIKILLAFTDSIRPLVSEIIQYYLLLGKIDFIRAKAKVAVLLNAHKPILLNKPAFIWSEAVHPLLFLSHRTANKLIVPFNLHLKENERILIISGPNAGGKSICLKTIGLLQYMLQCGFLVPMEGHSTAGIFQKIFLDIGDEQSIEKDLSTYTSHLLNIKTILDSADNKSLFLIDEFGAGTEPQLGAAIAESVLEELNKKHAHGIITTHYGNLKLMADNHDAIINGAMLFDSKEMKPLFRLKIGKPGSSYAYEIARQIGFPENILESAAKKTGISQLNFEQQLQQLELEKEELEKKHKKFRIADDFLEEVLEKYQQKIRELENEKEDILHKAKEQAKIIIENSNKLIENTIREIRESQAEKDRTRKLREKLETEKKNLLEKIGTPGNEKNETKNISQDTGILRIGDHVAIQGQNETGVITAFAGQKAIVAFETVKVNVPLDKLIKSSSGEKKTHSLHRQSRPPEEFVNLNDKMANFKLSIDVRGKRKDEALKEIQRYIDDALVLRIPEISILHGKGDGILRKVIRDFLKTIPDIKGFGDEHIERGGDGITVIRF